MTRDEFEIRKRRALAGLDAFIDVASAWRGRYEDDDQPAGIAWITAVIPEMETDPQRGWLCVSGTATPGIGWWFRGGTFCLGSLSRSLKGLPWPVTRRQFREAARLSGVSLPACHTTIYLTTETV